MRTQYILIDYENVQPEALNGLPASHVKVLLFVGASQAKLSFELVASMQRLGPRGEYVKIAGNGSNALDFHVAYYIGKIAALDAMASFHVVSRDTGFDPLIEHLRSQKIAVQRCAKLQDISFIKTALAASLDERLEVIADSLRRRGTALPRTIDTLQNVIQSIFQNQLAEAHLQMLLKALQRRGWVVENQSKLTYALPE